MFIHLLSIKKVFASLNARQRLSHRELRMAQLPKNADCFAGGVSTSAGN
jgi:hypothetical protein